MSFLSRHTHTGAYHPLGNAASSAGHRAILTASNNRLLLHSQPHLPLMGSICTEVAEFRVSRDLMTGGLAAPSQMRPAAVQVAPFLCHDSGWSSPSAWLDPESPRNTLLCLPLREFPENFSSGVKAYLEYEWCHPSGLGSQTENNKPFFSYDAMLR